MSQFPSYPVYFSFSRISSSWVPVDYLNAFLETAEGAESPILFKDLDNGVYSLSERVVEAVHGSHGGGRLTDPPTQNTL